MTDYSYIFPEYISHGTSSSNKQDLMCSDFEPSDSDNTSSFRPTNNSTKVSPQATWSENV